MWRSKEFILVAVMIVSMLLVGLVFGGGCSSTGNNDNGQPQPDTTEIERPAQENRSQTEDQIERPERTMDGQQFGMPLAEVAQILGIEQPKIEEAFAQAQSELRETPQQDGTPQDRDPQDRQAGGLMNDELMARVAEILGIEQQRLEDAFAQVQSETPEVQ